MASPPWLWMAAAFAGLVVALASIGRAQRRGWASRADRASAWALLLSSAALAIVAAPGALRSLLG